PLLGVPQLLVPESRPALALAAAWLHGFPSRRLGVVGVTGTDGKTTTCHLVRAMLDECRLRAGLISTVEVVIGGRSVGDTGHTTPDAVRVQAALAGMVAAGDRFAVVESTSHGLALDRVAQIAFDVAVLTNITHEHLDLHRTHEAYRAAKRRLFEWLAEGSGNPAKGWPKSAVVNREDPAADEFIEAARRSGAQVLTYAADASTAADVRATAVHEDADGGLSIRVTTHRWTDMLRLRLTGRFNVYNALAAVAVGEALSLEPERMRAGLARLAGVPGRMERIDLGQPFTVLVDFAHTPGALAASLDSLAPLAAARGGGVISLFGSPGDRDIDKRPLMGRTAAERSRLVVLTDDDPRDEDRMGILEQIAEGAETVGGRRDHDVLLIPDREEAIRRALELARPGDIVLLAGKGHERSLATAAGPVPWNEAAIARGALVELGYDAPSDAPSARSAG
ncbi:MAG TPA: UDP-N-acetylmuramoyl-L-alanyl-D-glutamate--2,6-diaminopimelate ligase, partial [Candidatus Caenarcaniphilales bacterium]|nr:UDP-N-acetylmuramoyl-L-alanyl-D-glutamate--2,6-diaminopimelate ligase [Candidatus Caenarcaniphilales bacterium]